MSNLSFVEQLSIQGEPYNFYSLRKLEETGICSLDTFPYCIRLLLENVLRNQSSEAAISDDLHRIANWSSDEVSSKEIPYLPARVLLQDYTGVPAVVDLAAMRSALNRLGGDPARVNPQIPVDLVIDHSVQVDVFGSDDAIRINAEWEFERNRERYEFLHWGQKAFSNFKVVPPATGIVHQVNLEYLANVVQVQHGSIDSKFLLPDTLVGTDSHTTMINALGVLGWGVGGIENCVRGRNVDTVIEAAIAAAESQLSFNQFGFPLFVVDLEPILPNAPGEFPTIEQIQSALDRALESEIGSTEFEEETQDEDKDESEITNISPTEQTDSDTIATLEPEITNIEVAVTATSVP